MMGSEIHYHVTYEGQDVILIIPTLGHETVSMGKELGFTFAGSVAHMFNKETGKNLEF